MAAFFKGRLSKVTFMVPPLLETASVLALASRVCPWVAGSSKEVATKFFHVRGHVVFFVANLCGCFSEESPTVGTKFTQEFGTEPEWQHASSMFLIKKTVALAWHLPCTYQL